MLKCFTVFDLKAQAFLPPFYELAIGAAQRAFEQAVNQPSHRFNQWPDDFRLFLCGDFDESTGELIPCEKQDLGLARQYVRPAGVSRGEILAQPISDVPPSQDISQ